MKKLDLFFKLSGLLLFIYILSKINLNTVIATLSSLSTQTIILSAILLILVLLLRWYRWRILQLTATQKINNVESAVKYLSSVFWGAVTPGKVGELSRAASMKNKGVSISHGLALVFFEKMFDLAMIVSLYLSTFFLFELSGKVTLLIITATILIYILSKLPVILTFIPEKYLNKTPAVIQKKLLAAKNSLYEQKFLDKTKTLKVIIITITSWGVYLFVSGMLAYGMGIKQGLDVYFVMFVISMVTTAMPVSIAGLGTREGALILYLSSMGISNELTVAYSFTFTIINIFFIIVSYPFTYFNKSDQKDEIEAHYK